MANTNRDAWRVLMVVIVVGCGSAAFGDEKKPTAKDIAFFNRKIRPVLIQHCYKCHSAKSKNLQGGLWLDTRKGIREGGETGPAVVPGNIEKSLLIDALEHTTLKMPPKKKLPKNVIANFRRWIKTGAADPRREKPKKERVPPQRWRGNAEGRAVHRKFSLQTLRPLR